MKRALLFVLLAACVVGATTPRIFLAGNSIRIGYDSSLIETMAPYGITVDTAHHNTRYSTYFRDTLWAGGYDADGYTTATHVVFNVGIHDISMESGAPRTSRADYITAVRQICSTFVADGKTFSFVTTTPVNEDSCNGDGDPEYYNDSIDHYNAAADSIVRNRGGTIIDLHEWCSNNFLGDVSGDGIHYATGVPTAYDLFGPWVATKILDATGVSDSINSGTIRTFNTSKLVWLMNGAASKMADNPPNNEYNNVRIAVGDSAPTTSVSVLRRGTVGYGHRKILGCEYFDGTNSYLITDRYQAFTNTSNHYFEVWGHFDSTKTVYLFGAKDDATNYWYTQILANGKIKWKFCVGGTADSAVSTDSLQRGDFRIGFMKQADSLKLFSAGAEVGGYDAQELYALGNKTYTNGMHIGSYDESTSQYNHRLYCFMEFKDTISTARITAHNALPLTMNLRLTAGGKLTDPSGVVAASVSGTAYRYGNSTHKFEMRIRPDMVEANGTYVLRVDETRIPATAFTYSAADSLADWIFTDTAGTRLMRKRAVTSCSKTGGTCLFFVRVSSVDTTNGAAIICQIGGDTLVDDTTVFDAVLDGNWNYVNWHGFDETSGSAADYTGNYTGTVTGGTQNQAGRVGKSIYQDGSGDQISLGDVTETSSAGKLIVMGWQRWDVRAGYIIRKQKDASNWWYLYVSGTDILYRTNKAGTAWRGYASLRDPFKTFNFSAWVLDSAGADNASSLKWYDYSSRTAGSRSLTFVSTVDTLPAMGTAALTYGYSSGALTGYLDEQRMLSGSGGATVTEGQIATIYNMDYDGNDNAALDFGAVAAIPVVAATATGPYRSTAYRGTVYRIDSYKRAYR